MGNFILGVLAENTGQFPDFFMSRDGSSQHHHKNAISQVQDMGNSKRQIIWFLKKYSKGGRGNVTAEKSLKRHANQMQYIWMLIIINNYKRNHLWDS